MFADGDGIHAVRKVSISQFRFYLKKATTLVRSLINIPKAADLSEVNTEKEESEKAKRRKLQ